MPLDNYGRIVPTLTGSNEAEQLHNKIMEFRLEMQRMNASLSQLQINFNNLKGDTTPLNNSLAAVNGWFLSMLESYVAILRVVGGNTYRAKILRKMIDSVSSFAN